MPTTRLPAPVFYTEDKLDGSREFRLTDDTVIGYAYPSQGLTNCWSLTLSPPDDLGNDIATVTVHNNELNNIVQMFGRIIAAVQS